MMTQQENLLQEYYKKKSRLIKPTVLHDHKSSNSKVCLKFSNKGPSISACQLYHLSTCTFRWSFKFSNQKQSTTTTTIHLFTKLEKRFIVEINYSMSFCLIIALIYTT